MHRWAVEDRSKCFDDLFNLVCDGVALSVGCKGARSAVTRQAFLALVEFPASWTDAGPAVVTRTSGSEGGPEKPTSRVWRRALRSDGDK